MKYNPEKHNRHSIRLKDYDYSKTGGYFVTVCIRDRALYFEKYTELKRIVEFEWKNIPNRYANIQLDEFIVMPNHLHGIINIWTTQPGIQTKHTNNKNVGVTLAVTPELAVTPKQIPDTGNQQIDKCDKQAGVFDTRAGTFDKRAGTSPAPTAIGDIIGSFKSLCVNKWLRYIDEKNLNEAVKIWQRNYYDHIIRNEQEFNNIRQYIIDNPLKWEFDRENCLSEKFDIDHDDYFRGVYEC